MYNDTFIVKPLKGYLSSKDCELQICCSICSRDKSQTLSRLADNNLIPQFFLTSTKVAFDSASDECKKLHATFARLETHAEYTAAQSALTSASSAWIPLKKKTLIMTAQYDTCYSTVKEDKIKQNIQWTDGGNPEVSQLPSLPSDWWIYSCSDYCLSFYVFSSRLRDTSCQKKLFAVCSTSKQFLSFVFIRIEDFWVITIALLRTQRSTNAANVLFARY